jgi:all-trans-8'-apo-beta-carotenal 15,15'-oxygenase
VSDVAGSSNIYLSLTVGTIPPELTGTLYRLGPARIRVGKDRYGHWFDSDGVMFAIEFDSATNSASAGARTVRTDRVVKQEAAGEENGIAVRGAWTQAKSMFANLFQFPTNPGNTAPIFHAGKLLALCEGGSPIEVGLDRYACHVILHIGDLRFLG